MSGICPYVCFNKTEYGYCRSTVCTNKSVIEYLTNRGCNTQFTYGPDSRCYRVPCTHCGGVGYITPNTTSVSPVQCPICMGAGDVVHYDPVETAAEPEYDLCKDNAMCCDDDCKKCAHRIYEAYMTERNKQVTAYWTGRLTSDNAFAEGYAPWFTEEDKRRHDDWEKHKTHCSNCNGSFDDRNVVGWRYCPYCGAIIVKKETN